MGHPKQKKIKFLNECFVYFVWMCHCARCSPARYVLYHVNVICKGSIDLTFLVLCKCPRLSSTQSTGAHLIIWKKALCLSTKEVVIPNSQHREDNRNLFIQQQRHIGSLSIQTHKCESKKKGQV